MGAINPVPSVIPEQLVVTIRQESGDEFESIIGQGSTYLKVPAVPDDQQPQPSGETPFPLLKVNVPTPQNQVDRDAWMDAVVREASRGFNPPAGAPADAAIPVTGDVLVLVHGFNNDLEIIMQRHAQLRKDLAARGYAGALVSFDWPCGDQALGYLTDRVKAHATAVELVNSLVFPFVSRVRLGNCRINVHVLAHSTGAYLFQEAVDVSKEHGGIDDVNWSVSQLLLIGADLDQPAMSDGHGDGESMLAHATRVTNYSNPYDNILKLSDAKRAGMQPRIGRVGLPADAPSHAVNVNCGDYFQRYRDQNRTPWPGPMYGDYSHSWHIGDPIWTDDLYLTICGDMDRNVIPTRSVGEKLALSLQKPEEG